MAAKSQRTLELERELETTKTELHHTSRMACAFMPDSKSEIKSFKSGTTSVDLILSNGLAGKKLFEPTAVIWDMTGDYPAFYCCSASKLRDEAHRELGRFATDAEHLRRDVCDRAYAWLVKNSQNS